ncbi:hypothetical protein [Nonomuraea sp. NPDC046570]|uniref:hypothetical protein n=1 Tax=Nonomuraea sp. NPDC046570 TaxID=3155255 RepID=UPI0033DF6EF9
MFQAAVWGDEAPRAPAARRPVRRRAFTGAAAKFADPGSAARICRTSPVTAEDTAFSLARHKDPKAASQAASYVTMVKKAEATDPRPAGV